MTEIIPTPALALPDTDIIALLLADKRSAATRRAYEADLNDFFQGSPSPQLVAQFLDLPASEVALSLARYKSSLRARHLSEATINRRLAAIRSLLKFANRLGLSRCDGRGLVDSEKSKSYRDTRGVPLKTLRRLLLLPREKFSAKSTSYKTTNGNSEEEEVSTQGNERLSYDSGNGNTANGHTLRVLRDEALLTLLIENALRRSEVTRLDVGDFDPSSKSLWITGKGRGSQKERVTLSPRCCDAIAAYLGALEYSGDTPLFRNFDRRPGHNSERLSSDGLYKLVLEYGKLAGVPKLTPHKLRHSAITCALDATNGDVRRVQKLSRHVDLRTLQIYDDSRADMQGEVSGLLSGLLQ